MNKPTPGPWRVADYSKKGGGINVEWGQPEPGELDKPICHMRWVGGPGPDLTPRLLAEAALIVAAVNSCFQINAENPQAVAEAIPEAFQELEGLRAFKRSVDEALNSGDGVYRP